MFTAQQRADKAPPKPPRLRDLPKSTSMTEFCVQQNDTEIKTSKKPKKQLKFHSPLVCSETKKSPATLTFDDNYENQSILHDSSLQRKAPKHQEPNFFARKHFVGNANKIGENILTTSSISEVATNNLTLENDVESLKPAAAGFSINSQYTCSFRALKRNGVTTSLENKTTLKTSGASVLSSATAAVSSMSPISNSTIPTTATKITTTAATADRQSLTFAANKMKSIENRLAHGCTSLMYACQHGDIAVVLEQMRSKVSEICCVWRTLYQLGVHEWV